jgi:hypothetical protein
MGDSSKLSGADLAEKMQCICTCICCSVPALLASACSKVAMRRL